jgi:heat-inducible transcriptional repressor
MSFSSDNRKEEVFRVIVREYCRTAEPVGSSVVTALLAEQGVQVSSATIRNDMAELEEEGLIAQPHTSAGRVPTEKGYRLYVMKFTGGGVSLRPVSMRVRNALEAAWNEVMAEREMALRELAKKVAELTQQTVVVRFDGVGFTYGVGNLLRQPEFQEGARLVELASAVDRLEEIAEDLERKLQVDTPDVRVMIGGEGFGEGLGSVVTSVRSADGSGEGTIGIVGPMRMDYDQTVALLQYLRRFFER